MNTFCMLAYIPSIILIVWLLIEVRKFVIVSKDLRQTETAWDKLERHREKQQLKEKSEESIPPQPPDYYPEDRPDRYGFESDSNNYPGPEPPRSRQRTKSRSRRPSHRGRKRSGTRRRGRMPPPGDTKHPGPPRRSRKKPLAGYDEELGYTTDDYDDSREEVDWD